MRELHGGEVLTDDEVPAARRAHGVDHVVACSGCGEPFFRNRIDTLECHGCWYRSYLAAAEEAYANVLAALRAAEIPAELDQTGGMNLAISFRGPDGLYFLLTDRDDVLSVEPHEDDGWTMGVYHDEFESEILWHDQADAKTPEEAVRLALQAISGSHGALTSKRGPTSASS